MGEFETSLGINNLGVLFSQDCFGSVAVRRISCCDDLGFGTELCHLPHALEMDHVCYQQAREDQVDQTGGSSVHKHIIVSPPKHIMQGGGKSACLRVL